MHKFWLVVLLVACNASPATSPDEDKKIITEISSARAKAFNEGNAAAIAEHFTDDAKPARQQCSHITSRSSTNTQHNWKVITKKWKFPATWHMGEVLPK